MNSKNTLKKIKWTKADEERFIELASKDASDLLSIKEKAELNRLEKRRRAAMPIPEENLKREKELMKAVKRLNRLLKNMYEIY